MISDNIPLNSIFPQLAQEFSIHLWQVENTAKLIDEGNTIPFIARYRKETHGSLDDQILRKLGERLAYLRNLEKRKDEIVSSLTELGVINDALLHALKKAITQSEIEDIYRPYRPKRKTRASVAVEKGLDPLAQEMLKTSNSSEIYWQAKAQLYLNAEKNVETIDVALQGARDIVAQEISNNAEIRKILRTKILNFGKITTKAATDNPDDSVFRMYYNYNQSLRTIASHNVLAINRGEKEGLLKVNVDFNALEGFAIVSQKLKAQNVCINTHITLALEDSYSRLIFPSLERETRQDLTEKASKSAIHVFSQNLRNLLMQPPIKNQTILTLDPAIRTGCKVAIVNGDSQVLLTGVIFPLPAHKQVEQATRSILSWIKKYNVDVIGIGNGTASRETQQFVVDVLKKIELGEKKPSYTIINEAGASVYSASELASQEFPELDVSLRSAVSIGRRLQDPLAELVKIDPKSIGVGQYQHDMKVSSLDESLKGVVEDCVNTVGVDINSASPSLLSYVSGIGPQLAKNIVEYRGEIGFFENRKQLKKVKKLGVKAFEQCAGFLRIVGGSNILDSTAVHPESYKACEKLLKALGYKSNDLSEIGQIKEKIENFPKEKLCETLDIGLPTLLDIAQELLKPARDPRDELPPVLLRSDVLDIANLTPGMELIGTVRNVVDFGAFVDIGVHRDGLIHISQLSNNRINHPSQIVKLGDIVTVYVLEVNSARNQIALSLLPPKHNL